MDQAKSVVVVGASRGIGAAVASYCLRQGYHVFGVSRTPTAAGEWIPADIATPDGIRAIKRVLGGTPLDALLFMGGVWEQGAFTEDYSFLESSDQETRHVISINTIAPIEITRALYPNLCQASNPRAIFMGSLTGLDHCASVEVANTAAKFGLRGAVQALRLTFAHAGIGFTVINPGNVATPEVLQDIDEGRFPPQYPIPLTDLIATLDWILSLSRDVDVQEVNLFQSLRPSIS